MRSENLTEMRNPILQRRARSLRCQATNAERYLWRYLRWRQVADFRFRRQVPVAGYIADFACLRAKVVVELDGGQHVERRRLDEMRDRRIEAKGFKILRFWDNEVFQRPESVLEEIALALNSSPTLTLPRVAGEGM